MNINKIKVNLIATVIMKVAWSLSDWDKRLFWKYIEWAVSDTMEYNKIALGVDPYKATTVTSLNFDDYGRKFLMEQYETIKEQVINQKDSRETL